ncbi:MAG: hypothetical protein Q9170_000129 [Blastenia crenularia]
MSALVGYGSSDEEEEQQLRPKGPCQILGSPNHTTAHNEEIHNSAQESRTLLGSMVGPQAPSIGPSRDDGGSLNLLSSYTANRTAIRNLTMPTIPNLDIPSSPPGSPPPGMEEKFEHFLQLKRKGVHFNEKLAGSSALKNPMLLQKLMASAGLAEGDQYVTALSKDFWDPSAFPAWAYKEELTTSQQSIARRKEEEKLRAQRDRVEFVPAANADKSVDGDDMVRTIGTKISKASAAERVAAGLNEPSMHSSLGLEGRFRGELERRGGHRVNSKHASGR